MFEPAFEPILIRVLNELQRHIAILKSYGWYDDKLYAYASQLYSGKMDDSAFLDKMIYAIGEQLGRAWNEGMVANGLDPSQDKTPEMETRIQQLIDSEYNHVTDLIDFINQQKAADAGTNGIDSRIDTWVSRYADVVNIATLETAGDKDKLEWVLGATELHCEVCAALNGIVATSAEWAQSGFHPQQPPNGLLTCGGWRCDCSLNPTDKRKTRGALDRLMTIAGSHSV